MRAALHLAVLATSGLGCASAASQGLVARSPADDGREGVAAFAQTEARGIDALAAVDPRLARRFDTHPSSNALQTIGTAAVLAEDATATMRGGSLDLFAFKARAAALSRLDVEVAKSSAALPEVGDPAGPVARPRLERELLVRAIVEERARAAEESALGDAAAPLVRAMVELWSPGDTAADWHDTDVWVMERLLLIRDSYATAETRTAASDLEPALFELEKLLVPMQFGKSAFALTQLHAALDKDSRTTPLAMSPSELSARARVHLGFGVTPTTTSELARAAAQLEPIVARGLAGLAEGDRVAIEKEARSLLFAEAKCPPVVRSRMRSASPPPERSAVCNVLTLAQRAAASTAALMALHDEIVVSTWALAPPSPRAHLGTFSFRVDDDLADTMKELAASRPLVPLAAGLVAAFLYRDVAEAPNVAARWQSIGEAPLDVVEREIARDVNAASPPPTSLHP
jgi:hypothetical protein